MSESEIAAIMRALGSLEAQVVELRNRSDERHSENTMRLDGLRLDIDAVKELAAKDRALEREAAARMDGRGDVVRWLWLLWKSDAAKFIGAGLMAYLGLKVTG